MASQLEKRCASAPGDLIEGVVAVWSEELDSILERMWDEATGSVGFGCHYQLRDEIVFEFARLSLVLSDAIVAKRLEEAGGCGALSMQCERARSESSECKQRVEETGRILAEDWKNKLLKWQKRSKTLLGKENETRKLKGSVWRPGGTPATGVENNHYTPRFTNQPWANEHGNVMQYSRGVDSGVVAVERGYKLWGAEKYLYSDRVEKQLAAIEGDARTPFEKLVSGRPFTGPNEKDWIAFLVAQVVRTPRFILRHINGLAYLVEKNNWEYGKSPERLRAAYETLFSSSDVYTKFHRAIEAKTWWVARAPKGVEFIKSDEPLLLTAAIGSSDSSLLFPLAPELCFVAGPVFRSDSYPLRVGEIDLSLNQVDRVNRASARNARASVIGRGDYDSGDLRDMFQEELALHPDNFRSWAVPPYWGAISESS